VNLAIVVATARDLGRADRLARAARLKGHEVSVCLMDVAVAWDGAAGLVEEGCEVIVCSTDLGDRTVGDGVVAGSQDDHAALFAKADRVVAFT
jgi:hypothetical protein